jgi:hypothetical protein
VVSWPARFEGEDERSDDMIATATHLLATIRARLVVNRPN